jgi:excinuclease ABC subunit B
VAQEFTLASPFALAGDQPKATEALALGVVQGDRAQTLLGVTGSGKTMAMARTI